MQYGSILVECVVTVTNDLFVCRNMKVKHQDEEVHKSVHESRSSIYNIELQPI